MLWYLIRFHTYRDGEHYLDLVRAYVPVETERDAIEEFQKKKAALEKYHPENPDSNYDLPRSLEKI